MIDILIPPEMWGDEPEGVVVSWLYGDGMLVEAGWVLAEFAMAKAQVEVVAPATGKLKILVSAEGIIQRGQKIGHIQPL